MSKFITKNRREIMLRQSQLSDMKDMADITNEEIKEYKLKLKKKEKKEMLDSQRDWIKNVIKDIKKRKAVVLVAEEENGKVIGYCNIEEWGGTRKHVGILGITILKNYRGIGIGQKLIKEAIKLAKKKLKQLKIIQLGTSEANRRAIKLAKKLALRQWLEFQKSSKKQASIEII